MGALIYWGVIVPGCVAFLLWAWIGLAAANRRKQRRIERHLHNVVEREIRRAYYAAGNPPGRNPTDRGRSE